MREKSTNQVAELDIPEIDWRFSECKYDVLYRKLNQRLHWGLPRFVLVYLYSKYDPRFYESKYDVLHRRLPQRLHRRLPRGCPNLFLPTHAHLNPATPLEYILMREKSTAQVAESDIPEIDRRFSESKYHVLQLMWDT